MTLGGRIDRRSLLIASASFVAAWPLQAGTSVFPLWPGQPPGGGGPTGPARTSATGAVSNIAAPALRIFRPSRPNGAAMLIAGGGGYKRIEIQTEAIPAALWLAARGITAYVLSYRLPLEGWNDGPIAPLQDAQRALRLIHAQAAGTGLDAARIGVLGFSAGGHLLGLAATQPELHSYAAQDAADRQPARADVAALIYPIITLEPPYDHTSTRRMLIGHHPDRKTSAVWSVQPHVGPACPPVFLVQAADDTVSNPENTVIMADACQRAHVPVELHRLPSGGHGFGMGIAGTSSAEWPHWYEEWLHHRRMLI